MIMQLTFLIFEEINKPKVAISLSEIQSIHQCNNNDFCEIWIKGRSECVIVKDTFNHVMETLKDVARKL